MAKKSNKERASASPAAAKSEERPVDRALKTKWSFPTQSRCPRCGGLNTVAVSTKKNIQYRQCRSAICLKRYPVRGKKV